MPNLIDAVRQNRETTLKFLRDAKANADRFASLHPDEPELLAPLVTSALNWLSSHNELVKTMGASARNLAIPPNEALPLYLVLAKATTDEVRSLCKAMGIRTAGSVYKIADKSGESYGQDLVHASAAIDPARMSATATICTPAIDRDGEVILPDGIDYDSRYRANPIVLWEHGFDAAIPMPIATSEDPQTGKLSLQQSEQELVATAFFTDRVKESEQIFALIEENIIRATSVRVDPTPGTEKFEVRDGKRVLVMPSSTLIEWSWGCMGVNPETVRKCLDRGRLAGSAITPTIRKTLRKHAAQPKGNGIGASFDA